MTAAAPDRAETETPGTLLSWQESNQRRLADALAAVRRALHRHAGRAAAQGGAPDAGEDPAAAPPADAGPSALETLCAAFRLSPFERDTLVLCAGIELDGAFGALCARAHGDPQRTYPTFSLALAALPGAHWSALVPGAPLRRWRLIETVAGGSPTQNPLRIDERILHYLVGVDQVDERFAGIVEPLPPLASGPLVDSHRDLAEQVAATWARASASASSASLSALVQLCGPDPAAKRGVALAVCRRLGLRLHAAGAEALPVNPAELEALLRLWERETVLASGALLLDCDDLAADTADAARAGAVARFAERAAGLVIVTSRDRRAARQRPVVTYDVPRPTTSEQRYLWRGLLGVETSGRLNGQIDRLVSQFDVGAHTIFAAGAEALAVQQTGAGAEDGIGRALWGACRMQARPRLDNLAERIESGSGWEDLVLPEPQRLILRDVAAHVRQRATVYETWGFAGKGGRGLGISALFSGVSGTGKTMAAEVLAGELDLDLYRIDLSSVVSKYIGETEKNLARVFDAAEEGGAILLFDEADALFGKRSEVKDSHDRYANIEVSYLLQRMERYRGLAILTTNLKSAIDTAFLRRIRFVVQFPFPDAPQRREIWRRVFPPATPTDGLDLDKLARLNVAGGNIRNAALNAAFLAADAGEPVRMSHLLRAAQAEYAKLEKTLTDTEVAGWA